jgi:catechol 2,3-dioxygenase-like lactoylglutathione lyase family enzyme
MFDHIGFAVSDYPRSKAFYEKALAPLGYAMTLELPDAGCGFGKEGRASFWIGGEGKAPAPFHLAFIAPDRKAVDAFYKAAMTAGGRDNGPPGLRAQYAPHYYAAFVFDPDGLNIEAVCYTPEQP